MYNVYVLKNSKPKKKSHVAMLAKIALLLFFLKNPILKVRILHIFNVQTRNCI